MTVRELIDLLQSIPPDLPVYLGDWSKGDWSECHPDRQEDPTSARPAPARGGRPRRWAGVESPPPPRRVKIG